MDLLDEINFQKTNLRKSINYFSSYIAASNPHSTPLEAYIIFEDLLKLYKDHYGETYNLGIKEEVL